jgi:tetratricopeptide (TPR) repeat protein
LKGVKNMKKIFVLFLIFCSLTVYAQMTAETEAYNSGVEYYNLKKFDKAVVSFTQAIEINPNNSKYYLWRGAAYVRQIGFDHRYETEMAIADLNRAIRLNPNVDFYYYWRGRAYASIWQSYRRGNYPQWEDDLKLAVENYEACIRLNPDYTQARKELAEVRGWIYDGGPPMMPDESTIPPETEEDIRRGPPPLPPRPTW